MLNKQRIAWLTCSFWLMSLSACTTAGKFKTAVIDPSFDLKGITAPIAEAPEVVSASSCSNYFLFLPIPFLRGSITEAYAEALKNAPKAQALSDVLIEDYNSVIAILYNRSCHRVSGKPVKFVQRGNHEG